MPVKRLPVGQLYQDKYNILDPDAVEFVPRSSFLQGLVGHLDHSENIEDLLSKRNGYDDITMSMRDMAQFYIRARNKGARLPKFARWVTSMYAANQSYAKVLAEEGQKAAKRKIMLSTDLLDIMRCADTPHFRSCFGFEYGHADYIDMPVRIAEECPGIAIAYVDDENGKMMGRQWLHHAKVQGTDEDVLVLTTTQYGCLDGNNLARLLAEKGIRVGVSVWYGDKEGEVVKVDYQGCFTKPVHHDLPTWDAEHGRYIKLISVK